MQAAEEVRLSEMRQKIKAEKAAAKALKVAEQKDGPGPWGWEGNPRGWVEEDGKEWKM